MNTNTTHEPTRSDRTCTCGAEEVFFEGPPGPSGYGCEVQREPYLGTLDRLGFHIYPDRVVELLHSRDDLWNQLSDREMVRLERWEHRARQRGRRG